MLPFVIVEVLMISSRWIKLHAEVILVVIVWRDSFGGWHLDTTVHK